MKKREDPVKIDIEPVRLRPLCGMPPSIYLTLIYALIFLIIFFLLAILPGLIKSGKRVTFVSEIHPVSVFVDDQYVGVSPITSFISPSSHTIRAITYGNLSYEHTFEVGRPILFTWFFPRYQEVTIPSFITTSDEFSSYLQGMLDEIIRWSAVTEFPQGYYYPPLLAQTARTYLALDRAEFEHIYVSFVSHAFLYVSNEQMISDATSAYSMLMDSLSQAHRKFLQQRLENMQDLSNISQSSVIRTFPSQDISLSFDQKRTSLSLGATEILGYTLPRTQIQGNSTTYTDIESFTIADQMITEYHWALFMQENPYWAKTNSTQLISDGKVDNRYLAGIFPTTAVPSHRPIRNISWYAAEAFCQWASSISSKHVSLPTEAMWEYAAATVQSKPYLRNTVITSDGNGPVGMLGGFWEFTSQPFVPHTQFLSLDNQWSSMASDIIIKGGSYLNDPSVITRSTVGVLGRAECSETTGFRIAWTD